jgi:hypothetical protein
MPASPEGGQPSAWDAMNAIAEEVLILPESRLGMSNWNHSIDDGVESDLRAGMRSSHAAWEFNGVVWYDAEAAMFYEAVRRYQVLQAIIGRPELLDLMQAVNDIYGWE